MEITRIRVRLLFFLRSCVLKKHADHQTHENRSHSSTSNRKEERLTSCTLSARGRKSAARIQDVKEFLDPQRKRMGWIASVSRNGRNGAGRVGSRGWLNHSRSADDHAQLALYRISRPQEGDSVPGLAAGVTDRILLRRLPMLVAACVLRRRGIGVRRGTTRQRAEQNGCYKKRQLDFYEIPHGSDMRCARGRKVTPRR